MQNLYARKIDHGDLTTVNLYEIMSGYELVFVHDPRGGLDYQSHELIFDKEEAIHAFAKLVNQEGLEIQ